MGKKVESLEDMDTGMLESKGWKLKRNFQGAIENTSDVYDEAMEYAENLANDTVVGMRSVSLEKSFFVDVYIKP